MKVKTLILSTAAAVIMPVVGFASPVLADSPGQVTASYSIKNLTQNAKYTNPANAGQCEELEYSLLLHNPSFSAANNVVVKATLPAGASTQNTSNAIVTYSDGVGSPASASATVNLNPALGVDYEAGSARLFDGSGNVVKSLPDGITTNGVNIGSLNGSTVEYVNFKAKTSCKQLPPPSTPPATPPTTPQGPATTLVNTGPGSDAAIFVIAMIAGVIGYRRFVSRRLSRQ